MPNRRPTPRRRLLSSAVASALLLLTADLQAATVTGRVVDSTGRHGFEGARVTFVEIGRTVGTGRDGGFRAADVPPGTYTVRIEYLGAAPVQRTAEIDDGTTTLGEIAIGADVRQLDNILVVGQRAGQAAALNQQREADNLKVVVSSDAIGQFPDQNVAESLQRLPGVSVARDQGEGRFVVIRGLDPALNTTTINGVRVPGPEDDSRQVNLDVISSDLLETLEVTKAVTPDMDGDSIGGNIEIQSLTAFDRGGDSFSARIEGSYNDLVEETSPKLAATWTSLLGEDDRVGIAASVSWFERDFGSDNVETGEIGFYERDDGSEVLGLVEGEQRDYTITRERLSATLNIDWRASDSTDLYWRNLYSEFSDDEVQLTNLFVFDDGDIESLDDSGGVFSGATIEKLAEARTQTQEIVSSVVGGTTYADAWTIDYNLAYTEANTEETDSFGATYVQEDLTLGYDLTDPRRPRLFADDAGAFADASAYALDEIALEPYDTQESETAVAVDFRRDMQFGDRFGYIQFGGKARLRDKDADFASTIFDGFGADYALADFAFADVDYPFGPFQPIPDAGDLLDFIDGHRGDFEIDGNETAIESQGGDYDVEEDIYAAYVMGRIELGRASLLGGVRVEQTDYSAVGTQVVVDEESGDGEPVFAPYRGDKDYTDVLPGLHLRWEAADDVIVRASANRTIARPNYAEAAPYQIIEITEDDGEFEREAEVGNPELDPLSSNNLDVAIEYYPGDIALLSAGVFYKDISDFIVLTDVAGTGAFEGFDEVIQPRNGDDAEVWGIELNWTQQFSFLPSPFDGLLLSANAAFIDSEATLPFRDGTITLPRQSDRVGNLTVGYEKYGLSLRLAGTYRSEYLDEIGELDDPAFDRYADDHFQVDFTARYRLTDGVQLYLNAINLNDEPFYAYFGEPRYNSQYEEYGRTYEAGVRFNF